MELGGYLGIPFYKVTHADTVYNEWYSATLNELKQCQSELDNIPKRIKEEEELIRYYGYGGNYSYENYDYHTSKLKCLEERIPYLEEKIEQLANSIDNRDLKRQRIGDQYTIIADNFESAQQEKINKANKYKQAYIERDAVAEFLCFILEDSFYPFEFECSPKIEYNRENKLLVVDYYLPTIDDTPNIKEIKSIEPKATRLNIFQKQN